MHAFEHLFHTTGPGVWPLLGLTLWHLIRAPWLRRARLRGRTISPGQEAALPLIMVLVGWLAVLHGFFLSMAPCCDCSQRRWIAVSFWVGLRPGIVGAVLGSGGLLWSAAWQVGAPVGRRAGMVWSLLALSSGLAGLAALLWAYGELLLVLVHERSSTLSLASVAGGGVFLLLLGALLGVGAAVRRASGRRPDPWRGAAASPLVAVLSAMPMVFLFPALVMFSRLEFLWDLEAIAHRLPVAASTDVLLDDEVPSVGVEFEATSPWTPIALAASLPLAALPPDLEVSSLVTCPPRPATAAPLARVLPLHALRCGQVKIPTSLPLSEARAAGIETVGDWVEAARHASDKMIDQTPVIRGSGR